jgi:hypothetical protein
VLFHARALPRPGRIEVLNIETCINAVLLLRDAKRRQVCGVGFLLGVANESAHWVDYFGKPIGHKQGPRL